MPVDHTKNIITVKNVSFSYDNVIVLKDINLTIHQGDYLGIIGPNGSGKTTLLKIMLGLIKPAAGEVKLFGQSIAKFKDWSKIGYVPQKAINFDLLFPATVYEVVAMGRYGNKGLLRQLDKKDDAIIKESLCRVEMYNFKDRQIGDLSSGQQQRVFIARALAAEPEVIFLDEPTVGVDLKAQEQFYTLLKKLNLEFGITLVMISHDLDMVAKEVTELACVNQNLTYHQDPKKCISGDHIHKLYGENTSFILHKH
jgi:zinc transport system ATP-binding protein